MDLITLITTCALSVEPKLMQALIFEQSGGERWSFSAPGESLPRVLATIEDALSEARALRAGGDLIRLGLAGLSADPRSATALMFAPCTNIMLAAGQITRLVGRCKAASLPDPIYCAIASYHGSWDRPDIWFADAVRATVEKGNAPNFDLPNDGYFDANCTASTARSSAAHADFAAAMLTDGDREREWSSVLFPQKSGKRASISVYVASGGVAAREPHWNDDVTTLSATSETAIESLFVPRSPEPRLR